MAVNKVVYDGNTLVDLTSDTVTPDALVVGHTAHGADGEEVAGANPYEKSATDTEVQTQADLIAQIGAALEGKGGSGSGIVPTGTKQIKTNGTHDVTAYAYAEVNVPSEMPETVTQATPVISISSSGKITATATQSAGYVVGGTKTATKQLTTKGATTITPTTSVQTAVAAGTYVTGDIKVAAVSGGGGEAPQWQNINTLPSKDGGYGYVMYSVAIGANTQAVLARQIENRRLDYLIRYGDAFSFSDPMWYINGSTLEMAFEADVINGKTVEYIVI